MEKYEQHQWHAMDQDALLTDLINRGYKILHSYARDNKHDVLEHCCDDEQDDYHDLLRWLKHGYLQDKQLKTDKQNFINNKTLFLGK